MTSTNQKKVKTEQVPGFSSPECVSGVIVHEF
jgi:hypothetical protein